MLNTLKKMFDTHKKPLRTELTQDEFDKKYPTLKEMILRHPNNYMGLAEEMQQKFIELTAEHIKDENANDYLLYSHRLAIEDAKNKFETATGDKKILYAQIIEFMSILPKEKTRLQGYQNK